jgi:hypothetical protein
MTKDCGCGESALEPLGGSPTTRSPKKSKSKEPEAQAGTSSETAEGRPEDYGATVSVRGPMSRLHPANGLFLKAVHLDIMQKYSHSLSAALGVAVGTGVVYGFGLSLQEDKVLVAREGLAITRAGQLLQSGSALRLPLRDEYLPTLGKDDYWLIVIEPAEELAGSENAYLSVCAEPCEGIGTIMPWIYSLVRLRLQKQTMPYLDETLESQRRSWLASKYFERERQLSDPWVVPRATAEVGPLLENAWDEGGVAPAEAAVPIGVLQQTDAGFILDTWTARRELNGRPGAVRWAGHLAMRPWPVFLAQILQFEDQLKSEYKARGKPLQKQGVRKRRIVDRRAQIVEDYLASAEGSPMEHLDNFRKLKSRWQQIGDPYELTYNGQSLRQLGFVELPPAGYLGGIADGPEGRAQVEQLFDGTVTLRFCKVRADYVAGAVQAAQYLDRVPLDLGTRMRPEVDILVPSKSADLPQLIADSYEWVAFVRHSPISCEDDDGEKPQDPDQTDSLEVFTSLRDANISRTQLENGSMPDDAQRIGAAVFAKGTATLQLAPDLPGPNDFRPLAVVGVAPTDSTDVEKSLTDERAKALIAAWQLDPTPTTIVGDFEQAFIVIFGQIPIG